MKKILILVLALLSNKNIYSQNFTFSVLRQLQIAYLGIENPLSCTVEGFTCKSIILTTDNGFIEKSSDCNYVYRPKKIGDTKIIISKKVNSKLKKIGNFLLPVRTIPDPIANVGGLNGGLITKGALNAQGGIGAHPPGFLGFELNYEVKSFAVTAIRNKELLFYHSNNNNLFNDEIHKLLDSLQKNDVVAFSSILVLMGDNKEVLVKPLEFVIE